MQTTLFRLFACTALCSPLAVRALTINVDFSDDTTGFFAQTPLAEAAVLKAAADLGAAIAPNLAPVTTNSFTGTNGDATVTMAWHLNYTNPDTGVQTSLSSFSFPANTVRIYAGVRPLSSATDNNLGEGGAGGAGVKIGYSYVDPKQIPGALALAQAASNAVNARGGGAIQGTLSKPLVVGGVTSNYSLPYGTMIGDIAFNDDPLKTGSKDSAAALANYWHYDPNTPVEANKFDFYSVALHELMHAIGFGTSQTWNSLASGTTWLGAHGNAVHGGSGVNLVSTDGHINAGIAAHRLSDGSIQSPSMIDFAFPGLRRTLTDYDVAFLNDLGYALVPEPGSAALLLTGGVLFARRIRRRP